MKESLRGDKKTRVISFRCTEDCFQEFMRKKNKANRDIIKHTDKFTNSEFFEHLIMDLTRDALTELALSKVSAPDRANKSLMKQLKDMIQEWEK